MQVDNYAQPKSNMSFGKVIKLKVFIDDLPSTDEKRIRKATRELVSILQKHKSHPKADVFIKTFKENVPDYSIPVSKVDEQYPIIRNLIDRVSQFLFTGKEADQLNPLAKQIGIVKGKGKELVGTAKTYEAKLTAKKYFAEARSFINNPNLRLRESNYPGEQLELRIYTKGKGNPESKNFKLELDEIMFRKPNEPKVKPEKKVKLSQGSLF